MLSTKHREVLENKKDVKSVIYTSCNSYPIDISDIIWVGHNWIGTSYETQICPTSGHNDHILALHIRHDNCKSYKYSEKSGSFPKTAAHHSIVSLKCGIRAS